jgi:site-specific recombinase XerD
MSDYTSTEPAARRYDTAHHYAHNGQLPPDYPVPQPTSAWPAENVALLERYREWLLSSGASHYTTHYLYVPMAGHVLGLNLKPHPQLDLDADLERALDYIKAKRLSDQWIKMCRNGLAKFRFFLRQQRGQVDVVLRPVDLTRYRVGLPDWLIEQMERYQHIKQCHWRPARLDQQIRRFWCNHTRLWRWLFEHYPITGLTDIKRQHVLDYVDYRLAGGSATSTVNQELRCFRAFLLHLQEQDYRVPRALLRILSLKEPDDLPRFLTDEQVRLLRDELERCVLQASSPAQRRDALLNRAVFYLLWQGGLRLGEVEELRLEDLDLVGRALTVRQGKGLKDRTVYLTDVAVRAVRDYLTVRGMGPTDHVFLYRARPVCKDLIPTRIKAAGKRVSVKVSPHRLRHTYATQLLNAGCQVTSIQKLMGHRRLNSTMIYVRVHNRTVADDYYAAMAHIEKSLVSAVSDQRAAPGQAPTADERALLLELANRLTEPQLDFDARLDLVKQMRHVLNHEPEQLKYPTGGAGTAAWAALALAAQP